jgi:hypothetical protein
MQQQQEAAQQQQQAQREQAMQELQAKAAQEQKAMVDQVAQVASTEAAKSVLPKGVTGATTVAEIQASKDAAKKADMEVKHKVEVNKGAESIVNSGGTEKELQGWAKFTDEFDLATIGMSLMAGQSGNFGSDLGVALMLGKQAADFRKDKVIAGEAAGRKEARANTKLEIDAFKAKASASASEATALAATANAVSTREGVAAKIRGQDISAQNALMSAAARLQAASITANGGSAPKSSPNHKSYAEIALKGLGLPEDQMKVLIPIVADELAVRGKQAKQAGVEINNPNEAADIVEKVKNDMLQENTHWFSDSTYNLSGF